MTGKSIVPQGSTRDEILECISIIGKSADENNAPTEAKDALIFAALWCRGNCTDKELAAYAINAKNAIELYDPKAKTQRDFLWASARIAAAACLANVDAAREAVERISKYQQD